MPGFAKISHTSFSVRDAEASAAWYREVLGLVPLDRVESPDWRAVLLLHEPSGSVVEFQQHAANAGEPFDPVRTGFDHLGFLVTDRAALDEWAAHLDAHGVTRSPVADREYGSVLCFKDPDGIQLEMFHRENHP